MSEIRERAAALSELLRNSHGANDSAAMIGAVHDCCDLLLGAGEPSAALSLLSEAAVTTDAERFQAALLQVRAFVALQRYGDALELAENLYLEHPELRSEKTPFAHSLRISTGSAFWLSNRPMPAVEILSRVRTELMAERDTPQLAWCILELAGAQMMLGNNDAARELNLEAVISARRASYTRVEALAQMNIGQLERFRCRWANAVDAGLAALSLFEVLENKRRVIDVNRSLAIVDWKRGRLVQALERAKPNVAAADELGRVQLIAFARQLHSLILIHLGEFAEADAELRGLSSRVELEAHTRPALLRREYLGDVHLEQGNAAEALKHYDEVWPKALALVPKGDIVAELRRRRAECYLVLGRKEDAYKASKEALEHCRELGDRYEEAATYRVLALSAAAMDKPDEAQKHFTQGFAYFDDIETPYEWGKLWMSYGDWLNGPGAGHHADRIAAREAYVAARDHFAHMGARAKLREAEARLAALDAVAKPATLRPTTAPGVAPATIHSAKRRPAAQVRLDARSEWAWNTFYMITRHEPLLNVLERAMKLAPARVPTLITGETGTGKELIAAAIHRYSKVTGHYISLNCAAVPRDMIESEMFGHVRGAFSGAVVERVGMVEAAANGTLFLDEVGEMSEAMQAKLLRFLESGEYRRVGESTNRHVATHVVAATNVPLERLSRSESFRNDLYWRLAQGLIEVPALRHRPGDVGLLVDHFLRIESKKMGKPDLVLTDSARAALLEYRWPGNVRELVGVVRRAVALAEHAIEVEHLELGSAREVAVTLTEELAEAERTRIENAMREHGNSPTSAARALGIPRTTLIMKLKRLGVRERLATTKPPAE